MDPSSGSPSTDEADEGAYAVVQAELPRPSPAPCPLRVTLTRTAMTQRPLLPGAEGGYPCVSEKYAHHLLLQELSLEMVPRAILYRVPI
ncbi:MAG TPA: hypothetical protein VLS89_03020 [Candidatus Nanopelagicales bacterium]|nr:hypothetical protein [Candidatus Nanopelagicales bacterium]